MPWVLSAKYAGHAQGQIRHLCGLWVQGRRQAVGFECSCRLDEDENEAEPQKGAEDCSSAKSKAQAARTLSKQTVTETKVQPSNKAASNDADGTLA